jgi:O-antigen/teichoic acid export membrane protein
MLKQSALRATVWSGADVAARQGVQFLIAMVLARMLAPADFGLVALLLMFTGIANAIADGGFSAALVQRRDTDHVDESTVFWVNAALGAILAVALCLAAPAIATFYRAAILEPLCNVMAIGIVCTSLTSIHTALLSKRLDFRTLASANLTGAMVAGAAAILAAYAGYGVWALVVQSVATSAVTALVLWMRNPWRPAATVSRASLRRLFAFGGYHLCSNLLEAAYSRLYTVFIGRMGDARELGFYANADTVKQVPGGFIGTVLARVMLPMFSATASDPALLRRGVQLAIRGSMLVNVPLMLGIAAMAEPLLDLLFGPQWLPAAPILRVLCLAGLLYPVQVVNLQVLMSQGHSRLMFRLEVAKKLVGTALIIVGAGFGVMGIAWSQVAFAALAFAINTHYTHRFLGYGFIGQSKELVPVVAISSAIAVPAYFVASSWAAHSLTKVLVIGFAGAFAFMLAARALRLESMRDILALFERSKGRA